MKQFLLVFSIFTFFSCYENERNCKNYKTGHFSFEYVINEENKRATFKRTKTLNINYYENRVDSSSIRWINDCEFILSKINPKSFSEKNPIHMKILSTTDTSYTFEYTKVAINEGEKRRVEKGIAYKIN